MITENKYYTPDITEFHVGFEYEINSTGADVAAYINFNKLIVKDSKRFWSNLMTDWNCIEEDGSRDLWLSKYRVKYLDKNDIESVLNIKPFLGGSYVFEKDCNFRPDWLTGVYVSKIRIYFHPENTWVRIEYLIEKEWEKFFEGSLKNKSELKNLLVWLGITHQV